MKKLYKRIERVLATFAGIALLIMMVLTFVDVVGRYGFNKSIFGTSEIIEVLMVVVIFAGMAFITSADQHIKVDIFDAWVKQRAPNLQRWSVLIFSLVVYTFFTIVLTHHAIGNYRSGKRTAVLDAPQWLMPGAAAVFSTIGVILFLIAIVTTRGKPATITLDDGPKVDDSNVPQEL